MTYDEAIKKVEEIVSELEKTEALSIASYKEMVAEAIKLLEFCRVQLTGMETELTEQK